VDTAAYQGGRVSPAYDSLVAKLIVWAPDREGAIARTARALAEFRIGGPGIATTAGFLAETVATPAFRAGTHTTSSLVAPTPVRA
jgi:acetyl-CoA carboxylase biotin carboxylase subunit